jgi:hypothetical protein
MLGVQLPTAAPLSLWRTGLHIGPIYPTTTGLLRKVVTLRLFASAIWVIASFGGLVGSIFLWLGWYYKSWGQKLFAFLLVSIMFIAWMALGARTLHLAD